MLPPLPSLEGIIEPSILSEKLSLQTEAGKHSLKEHLKDWSSDPDRLRQKSGNARQFQKLMRDHPELYPELRSHFTAFATMEPILTALWDSTTSLERESYGELMFLRPVLQPLNALPCLLGLWSFLRIYLLPGMSFILPLLALIVPYFIIAYVLCEPITFTNYVGILHSMISGQLASSSCSPSSSSSSSPSPSAPSTAPTSLLKQLAVVMMTIVQGLIQPYWSYKHLHSIGQTVEEKGRHLIEFKTRYEIIETRLRSYGYRFHPCPLPPLLSSSHALSEAILHPMYYRLALKYIGTLEVHFELYHHPDIHPVEWIRSTTPHFQLQDAYDLHLPVDQRKPFSIQLGGDQRHALLTGPNKGGKSTILRALSLSALLAHTYGCSIGHLSSTPFEALCVCLKPDDLPGSKSRFEREIEFTAQTLRYSGPILVFLDELFHSTNPPDAQTSCIHYTNRLWNSPTTISVISTHLFDWVRQSPEMVQRVCCPAMEKNGEIEFTYELHTGICTVSSVGMLLHQNGF